MMTKPASLCAACLLYAAAALGPVRASTNLLTNPGFETGTTSGWSPFGSSISAATVSHSGTYGALVSGRTNTWNGIRQSMMELINNGDTCTISGWVRLQNADSNSVAIAVRQIDDGGEHYRRVDTATVNDDAWSSMSGDFTLDVNGVLTDLFVYFEDPAEGINFYVDDASLITPDGDPNHVAADVNAITRHQTIEGFGASGAWYEGWLTAHPKEDKLYNILFRDLGLDIYRIRNTYGISQSNIDNSAEIVARGEASLGRDLKIMISSWSPPAYLKSDANTVQGTLVKDANGNYEYEEFAQWWLDSLNAYEANGIHADYVNMQNEPDCLPDWDSCRFRPTETDDWAGYNLAFDALAEKLNTMQNPPKLLAPETCNINRELNNHYLDFIIDSNDLYGYAHHLYGDGDVNNPDSFLPNMTNFAEQYNDKPILQTEYSLSNNVDFSAAMHLAGLIHNSLAVEGVSAYLHWQLFWEAPAGLVSLDWPWGSNPGYTINPVYYAFKHYSAFVHSGWQRLDVSNGSSNPKISAYISPDNRQLTVVLINASSDSNVEVDLSLSNFSVADGNVYRTTSSQNCALVGGFDPNNPFTLPAQSITTLALSGSLVLTDCGQVRDLGLNLPADLDCNCYVDLADLSILTDQWLSNNPIAIPPNHSPDILSDNNVNSTDFAALASDWLNCNDPDVPGCAATW